ncbi:MAG: hypothetical protein WD696_04065 [Bryobacteraceae bacterium]
MQGLAVLAALFLLGYGFAVGGWRGGLTGLVASIGVGSGLAILRAERGTGIAEVNPAARRAQRLGGLAAAVACLTGVLYGEWTSGWLWGLGGYLAGIVVAVSLGATVKLRSPAETPLVTGDDEVMQAAYRLLERGSRNPAAYTHDPRYVLWFACSHVVTILPSHGYDEAASAVGESPDTLRNLLLVAGYDLKRLTHGAATERFMYAMSATQEIFSDIYEKYDPKVS